MIKLTSPEDLEKICAEVNDLLTADSPYSHYCAIRKIVDFDIFDVFPNIEYIASDAEWSVETNRLDILKLAIEFGIDPRCNDFYLVRWSLHYCHIEIIKYLFHVDPKMFDLVLIEYPGLNQILSTELRQLLNQLKAEISND